MGVLGALGFGVQSLVGSLRAARGPGFVPCGRDWSSGRLAVEI